MSKKETSIVCFHEKELGKIKKIKGQLDGIEKMICEKRDCPEILAQVRSIRSGCLGIEASILETHLNVYLKNLISNKSKDIEKKIEEMVALFRQSSSKGVRIRNKN